MATIGLNYDSNIDKRHGLRLIVYKKIIRHIVRFGIVQP